MYHRVLEDKSHLLDIDAVTRTAEDQARLHGLCESFGLFFFLSFSKDTPPTLDKNSDVPGSRFLLGPPGES